MDLSEAFDWIPHELLIAKMQAYGFSKKSLTFFYSYLKRRNQCLKINNTYGVLGNTIMGPTRINTSSDSLEYFH